MKKRTWALAGAVGMFTFSLVAAVGCSDDASTDGGGGGGAFSCPAVGEKNCPQDNATTQAEADLCRKCEAEARSYAGCTGIGKGSCDANGKTQQASSEKCKAELDALVQCYVAGGPGGGDGGGGGRDGGGGGAGGGG